MPLTAHHQTDWKAPPLKRLHTSGLRLAALALLPSLLAACAMAPRQMPLPDSLSTTPALPVSERGSARGLWADESFRIGSWSVHAVKREASEESGFSLGVLGREHQHEGFSFQFEAVASWQGRCDYEYKGSSLKLGGLQLQDQHGHLSCQCSSGAQEASLDLDDEWRPTRGELRVDQRHYGLRQVADVQRVQGHQEAPGLRSPSDGYQVLDGSGRAIAAVEVLHPGRLWLGAGLKEDGHAAMACLMSGLLLYSPPTRR